jgi:uncharacterized protein YlxW (UPF0749 family)
MYTRQVTEEAPPQFATARELTLYTENRKLQARVRQLEQAIEDSGETAPSDDTPTSLQEQVGRVGSLMMSTLVSL